MKQQVNPIVMVVIAVVVLAVLAFVGMKVLNPPTPVERTSPTATNKPAEINGHPVPNNVQYGYMQKPLRGGNGANSVAPNQMPGGGPGQAAHP